MTAPSASTHAEVPVASSWREADPLRPILEVLPREVQADEETMEHLGYQALFAPVAEVLQQRFSGVSPAQMRLQAVPLLGQERAVLVYAPGSKARPAIVAFDEQRSLAWFKERPIHDLDPEIARFAFCPGPGGDIFLVFYDPPTGIVAARRWDRTGGILADFRLGYANALDDLAALYWPERGWLIAYSTGGVITTQLLDERGHVLWGRDGQILARNALAGPIRLALDTPVSAHVLWPGTGTTGRHHLDLRIDFEGRPLWRAPVDLGDAAEQGIPHLSRTNEAMIRADLPGKSGLYSVEVTAEGRVLIQ